jgi:mono/diheme cytochrome c family protein
VIAFACGLAAASTLVGCGPDRGEVTGTSAPNATDGEQVYSDYCAACHGADFEGTTQGPSHLDPAFDPELTTDADYEAAIREGAETEDFEFVRMPPIRSLDDQQIADVIAYIRRVQEERGFTN